MKLLLVLVGACAVSLARPATGAEYNLVVDKRIVNVSGKKSRSIVVNGQVPGPILRFREGEEVTINVTNHMKEATSVHWHGLILPGDQDGVPGFNGFAPIPPGQTFTYRFPIQQAGTYWYHAHSGTQEQEGLYGALIIDPAHPPKIAADREYIVLLSDFTTENPNHILNNLKVDPGYYNYAKRTLPDFIRDVKKFGLTKARQDRAMWRGMNMDATDIADTGHYTFLLNGKRAAVGETLLFKPGEKIRLRVINASAMSYFDVRIPNLKMTVVATDGADVEPVPVDEFRIAVAETYDVIVEPKTEEAFTFFAESIDRAGYARATLAPREGMTAPVPAMRPRAMLLVSEMGHGAAMMDMHSADGSSAKSMDHARHMTETAETAPADHHADETMPMDGHGGMHDHKDHPDHATAVTENSAKRSLYPKVDYGMGRASGGDHAAMGHKGGLGVEGEIDGSGRVFGWASGAPWGSRVLSYADLRSADPQADVRAPEREIVVRLGGNMERYVWTLDGKKFEAAKPIELKYGERVRLTFINESMMAHPMHLHGMFVQLENGQPMERLPNKTVVSIAPGKSYSALITADQPGEWAFHCHLLYHMEAGMMTKVVVARYDGAKQPDAPPTPDPHAGHAGHEGSM